MVTPQRRQTGTPNAAHARSPLLNRTLPKANQYTRSQRSIEHRKAQISRLSSLNVAVARAALFGTNRRPAALQLHDVKQVGEQRAVQASMLC